LGVIEESISLEGMGRMMGEEEVVID